ncbi:MAG TPA: hydantoinase/oxoprolinase family protein [Steroidobacteraceae bacterium]|nr:hydantoinase/oxoprolinase family protein [Steroidobacteraceae bacterium]
MRVRAATDVGGTYTDLVYYTIDGAGRCGKVRTAKVDTTPPHFEKGVMAALRKGEVSTAELEFFAHGATVVINAITERKGARVGLIATRGFRDVLEIGRGNRPDLFNFSFEKPRPFVERHLRREITERCNYKGEIETPPDLSSLPELLERFRAERVEAIAVCFLHAYRNPANEAVVVAAIREAWPEVSVLASHELSREWREYERTSTTVLSAYVHPVTQRYIDSLEQELIGSGFRRRPYMMLSNGGIATVATAKANPVAMVESGPASGLFAGAEMGKLIGVPSLILLDIGGTTAKCALVENGNIKISTDYHVERTQRSPGYPIQTAVSEIVEIGNGGGSIAWVDGGGKLHVGPQSAGASPGPAAYGRGGQHATTTDANLLLGRIDPASFAGGEVTPDWAAVHRAFESLGRQLGVAAIEAARGVVRIANANMANALRLVSTNKGYDPRDFALMAFGGGGPMHAVALARELKVPRVIVPVNSAVFSAWGMLLTDLRRDYVSTHLLPLDGPRASAVVSQFRTMEAEAVANMKRDGFQSDAAGLEFEHLLDMRYQGQEHTVKISVDLGGGRVDIGKVTDLFHATHEKRYTYRLANPVQIVNFHLVARAPVPKPVLPKAAVTGRKLADTILGSRRVDFDVDGVVKAVTYDGSLLEPGLHLRGPAVIQEPAVTLVVPPGGQVSVDDYGNYHIELETQ